MKADEPRWELKSVAFTPRKLHSSSSSSSSLLGLFPRGNATATEAQSLRVHAVIFLRSGGGSGCVAGLRTHAGRLDAGSCARLARFRHLKHWIRDVFRAEMSNPASPTVYLLQSTMLLYTRTRARTHAQGNMSSQTRWWCCFTVRGFSFAAPCNTCSRADVWEQLLWHLLHGNAFAPVKGSSRMPSSTFLPVSATVIKNNKLSDFLFYSYNLILCLPASFLLY